MNASINSFRKELLQYQNMRLQNFVNTNAASIYRKLKSFVDFEMR